MVGLWTERLTYFLCLLKKKITDKVNILLFVVHNQEDGVLFVFETQFQIRGKTKWTGLNNRKRLSLSLT